MNDGVVKKLSSTKCTRKKEVGYRWHYYDADFTAVDWKKYDDTKGQYDYVIYHNTTATERDDTRNWMSLTQWYNNAIFKKTNWQAKLDDDTTFPGKI